MKARLEDMITIAYPNSTGEIEGRRVTRHFAITRSTNGLYGEYTLTHLPTGQSVGQSSRFGCLLKYARLLEKIGDWNFTDPQSVGNIDQSLIRHSLIEARLL